MIAWPSGLRRWFKAPVTSVAWVRIPPLSMFLPLHQRHCRFFLQLGCFTVLQQGSVAEWSKALVLGTSHFGGVGSNPTTIKSF